MQFELVVFVTAKFYNLVTRLCVLVFYTLYISKIKQNQLLGKHVMSVRLRNIRSEFCFDMSCLRDHIDGNWNIV